MIPPACTCSWKLEMAGWRFVIRNSAIRVRPIISGPRSAVTSTASGGPCVARAKRARRDQRPRTPPRDRGEESRAVAPDRALSSGTAEKPLAGFTRMATHARTLMAAAGTAVALAELALAWRTTPLSHYTDLGYVTSFILQHDDRHLRRSTRLGFSCWAD